MSKRIFKDRRAHLPTFCRPTADILARIGDKWSLSVIGTLRRRRMRFSELENEIEGISQRMLAMTLRALERDGLVARFVHPAVPPRVEYELTQRGRSLMAPLTAVAEWANANSADIEESRRLFDANEGAADNGWTGSPALSHKTEPRSPGR
jgi:DNA-binding HxlR family transcriptional regulator